MKELTPIEWLVEELKGIYESEYFNLKIKEAKLYEAKQKVIDGKKNYLEGFNAAMEGLDSLYKEVEKHFKNHKV